VLYGPGRKTLHLQIDSKEFAAIHQKVGESSIVELSVDSVKGEGDALKRESMKIPVLISEVQRDPVSENILHVDFFAPKLTEKIEVKVPLIFEGEAPAVKELGGTLVKNIQEIELKALPQNLPKEIHVPVHTLKTFEDRIRIKDLVIPADTEIIGHDREDIVAQVVAPEKVEEELAKPIEEKVEEVERVEKREKEESQEL
jgi:large subunit ribosomal protein L25